MTLIRRILCVVVVLICSAANAEIFVIKDIQVNGLQRISLSTVIHHLPVKVGDSIDDARTPDIIRALYETDFFSDVKLQRSKNTLLITVVEREVIGSISIFGNDKLAKKDLLAVLKNVNVIEGQVLDHAILNAIKQALMQQYNTLGLYAAKISIDIKNKERHRAAITINIKEGPVAKIKAIKIVGNKKFTEKTLLKEFALTTSRPWSFFTNSDRYSVEKLDADLEKLRIYYMDRGYLHIEVGSPKVIITPDRKGIYITINITEGAVYRLAGFSLEGDLLGKQAEIKRLISLKTGNIFSRKDIIDAQAMIVQFLGDYGYGMPKIDPDLDIDENTKQIRVKFMVNPGQRVYVRRIAFKGNIKTNDEVLRREMRLQEGGVFSLSKLNESKRRLSNLGYLQDINPKIEQVPDSNNQVDLSYEVKEVSAISASLNAGLSDKDGFLYGLDLVDKNFLGTGKSVSASMNNSRATQSYGIGYHDPYFTDSGIGFSVNGYMTRSTPGKNDLSPYSAKTYGVLSSFDLPVSDYSLLTFGLGVEHTNLGKYDTSSKHVKDFIDKYGHVFNQLKVLSIWSYSNLDKAIFSTNGFAQILRLELYAPFNKHSLEFYTVDYVTRFYYPLFKGFVFHTNTEVGYGDGFGRTKELPFYKNFTGGGIGSVRGFEAGDLGGSRDEKDKSLGGKLITAASASIIFPAPIKDTIRPSIFIDIGNVYSAGFKAADLRASCGVQIELITPIAPLVFSLAKPIRDKKGDRHELFQFALSTSI